ncbi:MAG: hypothetical protein NTY88_11175, partial [Bacteroidetes bacterium]|nr:hypothetical protein [Bacteroidota bacterium]
MKKIYTLTVFGLLLVNLIFAQTQMPNASFETWNSGEPIGWIFRVYKSTYSAVKKATKVNWLNEGVFCCFTRV